jgi:hypothetical protein
MAKRNRAVSVLALPFAVIVWFVGWVFFWADSKKQDFTHNKTLTKKRFNATHRAPVGGRALVFHPMPIQHSAAQTLSHTK